MDRLSYLLRLALEEDAPHGDVTTEALLSDDISGRAVVFGREPFVLSGLRAFGEVFHIVDPSVKLDRLFRDGDEVPAGEPFVRLEGRASSLLMGERTALNLLQRLSAVATLTRRMVKAIEGTGCRLLDTRKTTPLWRAPEKEAVRHGGGVNHRHGLSDGVLIKDNHVSAVGSVGEAVRRARKKVPHTLRIEVEVESLDQLREALEAEADVVLLDNFSLESLKEAVSLVAGRALVEASGGVTLETVRSIAETGVDFVSCGALTHSAGSIDLSMEFVPT